jgi:hypothetical protein
MSFLTGRAFLRPALRLSPITLGFARRTHITLQDNLVRPTDRDHTHNNNLIYSQYTVTATCTSGLDGTISSTPTDETAPLKLKLTTPKAIGGSGDSGHNPDQFLAAGYSGKLNQDYHFFTNIGMNSNKHSI